MTKGLAVPAHTFHSAGPMSWMEACRLRVRLGEVSGMGFEIVIGSEMEVRPALNRRASLLIVAESGHERRLDPRQGPRAPG